MNERLLNSKRGYVLDGYPTTVEQAKQIFNDTSSFQQIDINRLPGISTDICLFGFFKIFPLNTDVL